jgi:methyl-accepting chemotaxis protein
VAHEDGILINNSILWWMLGGSTSILTFLGVAVLYFLKKTYNDNANAHIRMHQRIDHIATEFEVVKDELRDVHKAVQEESAKTQTKTSELFVEFTTKVHEMNADVISIIPKVDFTYQKMSELAPRLERLPTVEEKIAAIVVGTKTLYKAVQKVNEDVVQAFGKIKLIESGLEEIGKAISLRKKGQ